jgi:hypothetical protein
MMKSKALASRLISDTAESWAQGCQISWHCGVLKTAIEPQKRPIGMRFRKERLYRLFFLLLLPVSLHGQTPQDSWSALNRLKAGQGIEVIESNLKGHKGRFVTVTDELLSFQEKGSDVSIKRENIVRVSTSSAPKRGEHAIIGLVVGGAIGAGIGALVTSRSTSSGSFGWRAEPGIGALVGIAILAPGGALFGALAPAHTTMYRTEPHTKSPQKQD